VLARIIRCARAPRSSSSATICASAREDALSDLDLSRAHLDHAIGAKPQPLRQARIAAQARGQQSAAHRVAAHSSARPRAARRARCGYADAAAAEIGDRARFAPRLVHVRFVASSAAARIMIPERQ
jgi:hypothetical protein